MNLPTLVEALDFLLEQGAITPLQALESLRCEAEFELLGAEHGLDGADSVESVRARLAEIHAKISGANVVAIKGEKNG